MQVMLPGLRMPPHVGGAVERSGHRMDRSTAYGLSSLSDDWTSFLLTACQPLLSDLLVMLGPFR